MENIEKKRHWLKAKRHFVITPLIVVAGALAGFLLGQSAYDKAVIKGHLAAVDVVDLLEKARQAHRDRDYSSSREYLESARKSLEAAPQSKETTAYVSVLVDLCAAELLKDSPSDAEVKRARAMAEKAWKLSEGMEEALRATVARQMAIVELYSGQPDKCSEWLKTAMELGGRIKDPEIQQETIKNIQAWKARLPQKK